MKVYGVTFKDSEAGCTDTAYIAVLESDSDEKLYDSGEFDALFEGSELEDDDIFYYVRHEEIPDRNKGQILAGDVYDYITVLTVNGLEFQSR